MSLKRQKELEDKLLDLMNEYQDISGALIIGLLRTMLLQVEDRLLEVAREMRKQQSKE